MSLFPIVLFYMFSCTSYYLLLHSVLKGQCHEIIEFWFFSWISFPQDPEYTIRAVSNYFEKSRRYSQIKVHHPCRFPFATGVIDTGGKWKKIFNHKSVNYFVLTPSGSRVNFRHIFAFKFTLRSQQPDIVPITCPRCRWHRHQIYRRYQQH